MTAKPGYVFAYGGGTLTSKNFTLANVSQFSYADAFFGDVTCNETQSSTFDTIACTFAGGHRRARLLVETGTVGWNSDFVATRTGQGTLTYTVNADGTGYTGQVIYPAA